MVIHSQVLDFFFFFFSESVTSKEITGSILLPMTKFNLSLQAKIRILEILYLPSGI